MSIQNDNNSTEVNRSTALQVSTPLQSQSHQHAYVQPEWNQEPHMVSPKPHFFSPKSLLECGYKDVGHPKPWGTSHPDPPERLRARWSEAELAYLDNFKRNSPQLDQYQKTITSHCLKYIRRDELAVPIFHQRHVLNSDRMSTGFEALERMRKTAIQQESVPELIDSEGSSESNN
jgi:hypothetical protein